MKYDKKMINRLRRAEGQVRGLIKMMEAGQSCRDVVTQMSAVRSALDTTIGIVVTENLQKCLIEQNGNENQDEMVEEAMSLLIKSRK